MYCTKCGKEIDKGSKFCTSCGAPMGVSSEGNKLKINKETITKSNKVIWGVIAVAVLLVIFIGIKIIGSAGGKNIAKYKGSDYVDTIPSDYYNLIGEAPMINHMELLDLEKNYVRNLEKGYIDPDATLMACTEKFGEPILVPSSYGMVEGCEYSTKYDYVFISFRGVSSVDCIEYDIQSYDYDFDEYIPDKDKDFDAFIQWTYSDEVKGTGFWIKQDLNSVYEEDYKAMHGKNIISAKELQDDYSNMTYAEIANKLGSTGLLEYFMHYSYNKSGEMAVTWYCPEEDSVLVVLTNYVMEEDNATTHEKVSDLAKKADYYEITKCEVVSRDNIHDFKYDVSKLAE